MHDLRLIWNNPPERPRPMVQGELVSLSFAYNPQDTYELHTGDQVIDNFTPYVDGGLATVPSRLPGYTTTFLLQVTRRDNTVEQASLTVAVASGRVLLQTSNIAEQGLQGQNWVPFMLPEGVYSSFELEFDNVAATTEHSLMVSQLGFDGQYQSDAKYSGTGWGNDQGGHAFFEYEGQPWFMVASPNRYGPHQGFGTTGWAVLRPSALPDGYATLEACLIAPKASAQKPLASRAFSYYGERMMNSGIPNAIQIGFGLFNGGSPPNALDTLNAGIIRLYGVI